MYGMWCAAGDDGRGEPPDGVHCAAAATDRPTEDRVARTDHAERAQPGRALQDADAAAAGSLHLWIALRE